MASVKGPSIAIGLAIGVAAVLAGPVYLLWDEFRIEPWDANTLRVHFESARYEAGSLVFQYRIQNRTHRTVRLLPDVTEIKVRQEPDRPSVGYAFMRLPLELPGGSSQPVEVHLTLSAPRQESPQISAENTRDVLQHGANPAEQPGPLSKLPMRDPPKPFQEDPPSPETWIRNSLDDVEGFELVNPREGLRLVLPRGW